MDYQTYYLRFNSKHHFSIRMNMVGYKFETDKGDVYYRIPDVPGDIDIIGDIYNDDQVYERNEETGEITIISPATKKEGFHANIILKGELPEELQDFVVTPQNPHRVFF